MEGRCFRQTRSAGSPITSLVVGLGLLAAGCGGVGFIGTTASSFLRHARESDDPNVRYAAFTKLADPSCYSDEQQKAEAVAVLAEALQGETESVASQAAICRTLGALGRPEALPALRFAVESDDPIVRTEACRALGRVGTAEDATRLARVMTTDVSRDCRVAAIEAMGELEEIDPRVLFSLVDGMRNPDPAIRAASYESLKRVSGEDFGFEVNRWEELAKARLGDQAPVP